MLTTRPPAQLIRPFSCVLFTFLCVHVEAQTGVVVTQTTDEAALADALNADGLTINSVTVVQGAAEQFGTYFNFLTPPILIGDGIIVSSGSVLHVAPPPDPSLESPMPSYDMTGAGTTEFDAYGPGHIDNFQGCYDVAVVRVDFHLEEDSEIKFDIVFGSVEYPYYTSSFTDAFLVFLDDTLPENQITFDDNGTPVQVGDSFAGLESTADLNSVFADPHAVLPRLTTTSAKLESGDHTLWFEVGDVNDGILDSAAFIANLRADAGTQGTEPSDDLPGDYNRDEHVRLNDYRYFVDCLSGPGAIPAPTSPTTVEACYGAFDLDIAQDDDVDLADFAPMQNAFGNP